MRKPMAAFGTWAASCPSSSRTQASSTKSNVAGARTTSTAPERYSNFDQPVEQFVDALPQLHAFGGRRLAVQPIGELGADRLAEHGRLRAAKWRLRTVGVEQGKPDGHRHENRGCRQSERKASHVDHPSRTSFLFNCILRTGGRRPGSQAIHARTGAARASGSSRDIAASTRRRTRADFPSRRTSSAPRRPSDSWLRSRSNSCRWCWLSFMPYP